MEYIKIVYTPSSRDESQLLLVADQQRSETPLLILIIKPPMFGCYSLNLGSSTVKIYKTKYLQHHMCVSLTLAGRAADY